MTSLEEVARASAHLSLEDSLRRIVSTGQLMDWIRATLDHGDLLNEVASRSYTHANGFRKIVLTVTSEFGAKIRIHHWPTAAVTSDANAHNRPWRFASMIINGGYSMDTYQLDRQGEVGHAFTVGTLAAPGIRSIGPVQSIRLAHDEFLPGSSYEFGLDRLHRIGRVQEDTISVVLQGAHERPNSIVVAPVAKPPSPYQVDRPSMTQVTGFLSKVADLLPRRQVSFNLES